MKVKRLTHPPVELEPSASASEPLLAVAEDVAEEAPGIDARLLQGLQHALFKTATAMVVMAAWPCTCPPPSLDGPLDRDTLSCKENWA